MVQINIMEISHSVWAKSQPMREDITYGTFLPLAKTMLR